MKKYCDLHLKCFISRNGKFIGGYQGTNLLSHFASGKFKVYADKFLFQRLKDYFMTWISRKFWFRKKGFELRFLFRFHVSHWFGGVYDGMAMLRDAKCSGEMMKMLLILLWKGFQVTLVFTDLKCACGRKIQKYKAKINSKWDKDRKTSIPSAKPNWDCSKGNCLLDDALWCLSFSFNSSLHLRVDSPTIYVE